MELKEAILKIIDFMRERNFKVDPLPKVMVDDTENLPDDPFISTGSYSFQDSTVTLRTNGRHLKDVLRTFCHEMVHHNQKLTRGDSIDFEKMQGSLEENGELREIEKEAFDKGNLLFRWWTETENGVKLR